MARTEREIERERLWPAWFIGLLAILQLLLTFGIIGLETTSLLFDLYRSMSFAGYVCSFFFTITWISMFTVTCCNRHSLACTTHVLIENVLSIIAASVLIYFDIRFLDNPYTCLFFASEYSCSQASTANTYVGSSNYGIYSSTGYTVKLACIKAQLACAAVMLATGVVYIITYIVVAVRVRKHSSCRVSADDQPPLPPSTVDWRTQTQHGSVAPNFPVREPLQAPSNPVELSVLPYQQQYNVSQRRFEIHLTFVVPATPPPVLERPTFVGPVETQVVENRVPLPRLLPALVPPPPPPPTPPPSPPVLPALAPLPPVLPPVDPQPVNLSPEETSWRNKFPRKVSLVLAALQFLLIAVICVLGILSLVVHSGFEPTVIALWAPTVCSIAPVLKILLEQRWNRSRLWATRVLLAEMILLVFAIILIGITGDYVKNNGYISSFATFQTESKKSKYQITQAELALGVVLMVSGLGYVGLYVYVTFVALWRPFRTLDVSHIFHE